MFKFQHCLSSGSHRGSKLAGFFVASALLLVTILTSSPSFAVQKGGSTPPSNPAIAYLGSTSGGYSLSVMNADGARKTPIVTVLSGTLGAPSWSPSGQNICFYISGRLTKNGPLYQGLAAIDVSVVNGNATGTNFRMLVNDSVYIYPGSYSPDGTSIAFTRVSSPGIFTIPVTGGTPTQIYAGNADAFRGASWSPDGSQLAFVGGEPSSAWLKCLTLATSSTITICQVDGSGRRPEWSRTSLNSIVFDADSYNNGVWIVSATENATPVQLTTNAWFPTWSPDDSRVLYTTGTADNIVIKNRLTGVVTSTGAKGRQANWRRF